MRLIDADALKESGLKFSSGFKNKGLLFVQYREVIKSINDAKSVDAVEVRHSMWKYYRKQNIAVCVNCSFERDLDVNFGKAVCCPNCGAKMD